MHITNRHRIKHIEAGYCGFRNRAVFGSEVFVGRKRPFVVPLLEELFPHGKKFVSRGPRQSGILGDFLLFYLLRKKAIHSQQKTEEYCWDWGEFLQHGGEVFN